MTSFAEVPAFAAHKRLLEDSEDDPLNGVANLFDVALVFAVALLIAVFTSAPGLLSANPGQASLETLQSERVALDRFRPTQNSLGGEGVRLGTAYRLQTGEVVYVPDVPEAGEQR